MTRYSWVAAVAVGALGGGCMSTETGAINYYSAATSCPKRAMTVVDTTPPAMPEIAPPDEVRADPARLEVWHQTQLERRERADDSWRFDYYNASGCGHQMIVRCRDSTRSGMRCERVDPQATAALLGMLQQLGGTP
jgi:hypothetical protein